MSDMLEEAKEEIHKSLTLSSFCMRRVGLSFISPKTKSDYWKQKAMFVISMSSICYHVFGDIIYIALILSNSPRVEDVVPLLHTFGYGALSIAKVFVLWYKIDVFSQLTNELADIWPMPPLDEEYQGIKDKSLRSLSLAHRSYLAVNIVGVWFYNITPIAVYFYQRYWTQEEASVGFVWKAWYPFDKHEPVGHFVAYVFEMFAGQICVWIMVSTDLLFTGMASHIVLLLRRLQHRLEIVGDKRLSARAQYEEITGNIKLHQRLIKYCNHLEDAFSLSNLVNVVFSSVNICCVVFVIVLLEPLMAVSNKLFLGSALLQIGMICWYADDIFHALSQRLVEVARDPRAGGYLAQRISIAIQRGNAASVLGTVLTGINIHINTSQNSNNLQNSDVSKAAYNSRWYVTDPRCRRALIFLIKRAQKPIAFTAMNFMDMNLVTYTSILTRSYSYFALLYTMYSEN